MNNAAEKPNAFRTILPAWLVVGILDISSALTIWFCRGVPLQHGLQSLVLPLLGPSTFEGGLSTAALGLATHFFIAFVVVVVFYLASRQLPLLRQQAFLFGILYGIAVYLVMYWIVLPAAFPKFRHSLSNDPLAIAIHIVLIGLPTASWCAAVRGPRRANPHLIATNRSPAISAVHARLKVSSTASPSGMTDPLDFTGKVVLVTGSSRGLGAAMIKAFGERGAQCVVNFISDPEGQK